MTGGGEHASPAGTARPAGLLGVVVVRGLAAIAGQAPSGEAVHWSGPADALAGAMVALEPSRPRWAVYSAAAVVTAILPRGVRLARVHDIAEAHRLLAGGWPADPVRAHAYVHGLDLDTLPSEPGADLFAPDLPASDPGSPLLDAGYLRPDAFSEWAVGDPARVTSLARLAVDTASLQHDRLASASPRAVATSWAESAAAVLCAELEADGLPVDLGEAEKLVATAAGPRPRDEDDARRIRRDRDRRVLALAPGREATDLRNPAQVLALLRSVGVLVDDTRKWSLEPFRATHPLVAALLDWRRDERIATTYGYHWLDACVGADGRLRGGWTACDGGGGRMTAQNGLHNLPALLRQAIAAEDGHVFVRADLGQIEPRVLAAVSGDRAFAAATRADDLYAPVAEKLGVDRPAAKVAVLAAMYGQRSGAAGRALGDLERAYPVAMRYLDTAYRHGVDGTTIRTFGGRALPVGGARPAPATDEPAPEPTEAPAPPAGSPAAAASGRGRYVRNAVIQGAAAELFKAWAATVRAVTASLGGRIVLCLHDELLVHVPAGEAGTCAEAVDRALTDAARRWSGGEQVRFVADTSVIRRWSEAKE